MNEKQPQTAREILGESRDHEVARLRLEVDQLKLIITETTQKVEPEDQRWQMAAQGAYVRALMQHSRETAKRDSFTDGMMVGRSGVWNAAQTIIITVAGILIGALVLSHFGLK